MQRSVRAEQQGVTESLVADLTRFRESDQYSAREKAALAWTEAIVLDAKLADDALWAELHRHFSEPELVELGCMIGLTLGQQSWLRLLNIDHHQVMPGTAAAMAPGFETADAAAQSKGSERYWAHA